MTSQDAGDQPARTRPTLAGVELRAPRTPAEKQSLLDLLWSAVPAPVTLQLAHHIMTFQPTPAGLRSTGAHQWGPFEVELTIGQAGHVSIELGRDLLTGAPLDTKRLLDLADTVHTTLVTDPSFGPLFLALNAVGHQRLNGAEADDDRAVTLSALAGLL